MVALRLRGGTDLTALLPPRLQGRGFREPMDVEDRLQGGQFESLPADKGGPGPAKCGCGGRGGAGRGAASLPACQPAGVEQQQQRGCFF